MSSGDRVQSFARGEEIVVDVNAIERDLASLWRQASAEGSVAVTRACLWNIVFYVEGEALFWRIKKLIDAISPAMPARVLVLRPDQGEGQELEAWISANCKIAPDGKKLLCSEEVTITGRRGGTEHFPSVLRALLVPDVPVAFYWVGAPPTDLRVVRHLMAGADRLLIDSADLSESKQLHSLSRLCSTAAATADVSDMGWLRFTPYRALIASLFDAPVGADPIVTARRVSITTTAANTASGMLMLGWMASRLRWGRPARVGARGNNTWRLPRMGGEVLVELRSQEAENLRDGFLGIEIESAGGSVFSLKRVDAEHMEVRVPNMPSKVLPSSIYKDEELMVASLGERGLDPLFQEVLQRSSELERAGENIA
jgi:glucose-6-phosphate dehydrogenase assembly protein OpcA